MAGGGSTGGMGGQGASFGGNASAGGYGGFGGMQQQNPFGGGYGGGFNSMQGGGYGQQSQSPFGGGYGGGFGGGYGGGFNPMQGGYGGGFNPMQGGYGGGFNPMQGGYGGGYGGGFNPMQGMGQMAQQQMAQQAADAQRQYESSRVLPKPPAFFQDQEFQGYRQQSDELSKQMNEYMQKAPMYQQLQDLQNKMRGVQERYAVATPPFAQAGLASLLRDQPRVQQAQATTPPPQEQERPQVRPAQAPPPPPPGSYYVPTGTPYNPAMD